MDITVEYLILIADEETQDIPEFISILISGKENGSRRLDTFRERLENYDRTPPFGYPLGHMKIGDSIKLTTIVEPGRLEYLTSNLTSEDMNVIFDNKIVMDYLNVIQQPLRWDHGVKDISIIDKLRNKRMELNRDDKLKEILK